MLKLTQLFSPATIRQGMIIGSKKRLFEVLATIAAEQQTDDPTQQTQLQQATFEFLLSREKLGNSALGGGVAMPKGRINEGGKPIGVFIQLETPIEYEAADKREVDLVFALLIPADQCTIMIPQLPELIERLQDKTLAKQLRAAQTEQEIWQVFEYCDQTCAEQLALQLDEESSAQQEESEN